MMVESIVERGSERWGARRLGRGCGFPKHRAAEGINALGRLPIPSRRMDARTASFARPTVF